MVEIISVTGFDEQYGIKVGMMGYVVDLFDEECDLVAVNIADKTYLLNKDQIKIVDSMEWWCTL